MVAERTGRGPEMVTAEMLDRYEQWAHRL